MWSGLGLFTNSQKKDMNISVRAHGTKGSISKYNIAKGMADQSLVTKVNCLNKPAPN